MVSAIRKCLINIAGKILYQTVESDTAHSLLIPIYIGKQSYNPQRDSCFLQELHLGSNKY